MTYKDKASYGSWPPYRDSLTSALFRVMRRGYIFFCNALRHSATHCNTLQHTAAHCNTLQHTATHGNTLLHTATHCNTLQHTVTHFVSEKERIINESLPESFASCSCIYHGKKKRVCTCAWKTERKKESMYVTKKESACTCLWK